MATKSPTPNDPKPAKHKTPIESFGAPLFNALVQGAQKRYEIPNVSYRDAVTFRHRCHMLRNRMREENHPLANIVSKTKISITWDHEKVATRFNKKKVAYPVSADSKVTLVIEPFDDQFAEALKRAGIDTHRPVTTTGIEPPPADGTPTPTLDDLMENFK